MTDTNHIPAEDAVTQKWIENNIGLPNNLLRNLAEDGVIRRVTRSSSGGSIFIYSRSDIYDFIEGREGGAR